MENTTIIKTLTETTYDSVQGYRKAAEKAKNPQLKGLLVERAVKREGTLLKLNAELTRQGGSPVTSGTATGALHRIFADISDLFENADEGATERVEEGEDYIAGKFEEALKSDDLDPRSRVVLQEAYSEVKQGERLTNMLESAFD